MKIIDFKNHKGEEFLFVKIPNEPKHWFINNMFEGDNQLVGWYDDIHTEDIELPKGHDYELIAPLSEMTEELWKGVVDEFKTPNNNCYKNYSLEGWQTQYIGLTATESGESLLQYLQIYSVNPYGEKPVRMVPFMSRGNYTENQIERIENFNIDLRNWQQAESNTGNWVLIQKIK